MHAPDERSWLAVRVQNKTLLAENIIGLELVATDGSPLPAYSAGAHIDVELPNGLVRQYSLCGDGAQTHHYEVGILLALNSRGGSASAHRDLENGSVIRISRPRNLFPLTNQAQRSLLFAGGIGITPMLAMAGELARHDANFELHYCSRSLSRTAFVERLHSSSFADHVQFHFDDDEQVPRFDAAASIGPPQPNTHIYVCGPEGFMHHVINTASALGWEESQIHFEYFAAPSSPAKAADDGAFEIRVRGREQSITVPPDLTAAQALIASGVDIPLSCEQGICGTCLMRVLEGEPDHRDMYLSEAERSTNDRFLPCCSRAKTGYLLIDF
ncbi:TPA: 2Fe-2S iron-sulfur cluster-binding protein [Pseudomonas aeruginosa]